MAKRVVEYRDFRGGEFGRLDAWNAPKNSWTGVNMLLYRSGELGVRAGLRDVTPAGVGTGLVRGLFTSPSSTIFVTYLQGTAAKQFTPTPGNSLFSFTGALTTTPTLPVQSHYVGDNVYFVTSNSGAYKLSNGALTALTGSPNGITIAAYGDRMVIGFAAATANRLRFSAAADFNSWPSANFIDVGDSDFMSAIFVQRGHLAILKERNGLFVLTGVPGVNETLRQASRFPGPKNSRLGYAITPRDKVWYIYADGQTPVQFNGASATELDHLAVQSFNGGSPQVPVGVETFRNIDPDGALFLAANSTDANTTTGSALMFYNGVWTKHSFGVALEGYAAHAITKAPKDPSGAIAASNIDLAASFTFTDGGGAAAVPKFYGWTPTLDRPGSETVLGTTPAPERAGDASTAQVSGSVTFPEWHSETGEEFYVRQVIVDFRKWNTGGSLTNHFDLKVTALRRYDAAGTKDSTTLSFDEAGSLSSSAGTLARQVFSFGDQGLGSGFQLAFSNVRGVAIQRIAAILDTQPGRYGA